MVFLDIPTDFFKTFWTSVGKINDFLMQAKDLYGDIILPHRESDFKKAGLRFEAEAVDILGPATPPQGPSVPAAETVFQDVEEGVIPLHKSNLHKIKEEEKETDEDPDSSSSSGSDADKAEENALADYLNFETTRMVSGSSPSSYIHVVDESKTTREDRVGTGCNARPRRATAEFGTASKLRGLNRRFCPKCTGKRPRDVLQKLSE